MSAINDCQLDLHAPMMCHAQFFSALFMGVSAAQTSPSRERTSPAQPRAPSSLLSPHNRKIRPLSVTADRPLPFMSVQTESSSAATSGGANGPGLTMGSTNGLAQAGVNQSLNHYSPTPHTPRGYTGTQITPYGTPQYPPAANNLIPTYFPADASHEHAVHQPPRQDHSPHAGFETYDHERMHSQHPGQYPHSPGPSPPPSTTKRKNPLTGDDADHQEHVSAKKRKPMTADGLPKEECDVGPAGGARHWSDEEKGNLFIWMLNDDDRWEIFGSKMNTVFREGSLQLFHGRKSFTALKSCYHRNCDVFKQIYAFESFLARPSPSTDANLSPDEAVSGLLPNQFSSPLHRQTFLEKKLEAAKATGVNVGHLTVKVIDHWLEMGWYALFKKRFREDPKTGQAVPKYSRTAEGSSPNGMTTALPNAHHAADEEAEGDGEGSLEHQQTPSSVNPSPHISEDPRILTEAQRKHLDPFDSLIPPPFPSASTRPSHKPARSSPPASSQAQASASHPSQAHTHGSVSTQPSPSISGGVPPSGAYGYAPPAPGVSGFYPSPPAEFTHPSPLSLPPYSAQTQGHGNAQLQQLQMQTTHALTHIASLTQTLVETCSVLGEMMRAQAEESKMRLEMMRRRDEREEAERRERVKDSVVGAKPMLSGSGTYVDADNGEQQEGMKKAQKAGLATQVLANPAVGEEVKRAAAEYLKRLFQT